MFRAPVHILLHVAVPAAVALGFYRKNWKKALVIMMMTMIVDLDHLLATPLYDPNRCSIGFHPLHSWYIQPVYLLLLGHPKTRLVGLGLVIHMLLDLLDCGLMRFFNL